MPNPSASDKSTFAIVFDGLSERNFTGSAHWDTAFKEMHDCGREVADFLSTTSALNLQLDADELGEHAVRRRSGGIWRKAMRLAVDCRILLALLVALVGLVPSSAWSEDRGASFGRAVSTFRVNPTIYSISWSPNQRHLAVVYPSMAIPTKPKAVLSLRRSAPTPSGTR